ncbi:EDD domain protein, DegV family [Pelagirhabdus alkalitolerans]|uniref:EDD domain protein, DegV family n=1 Tax=Pelagirhabdus alkalitolerans TaxID=1612202 RepID=A0A1G6L5U1_9BACI|nr:DegV family protein [Pelagirhabdus alkalitolerans]SDC38016.1 EDD domain protein, DegV family [Pelagirhabdus alkalitolerans]
MKVAVLTDSTAYLPEDIREDYGIEMVPLTVSFGDTSYQEEIELKSDQFYPLVKEAKAFPKTSQPSIGYMTEKLQEIAKDYDALIAVHLSSGISGTFQSMQTAGEMVDDLDVYVFDSEISCMPQGFYVVEAAKLAEKQLEPEEIIARLEEMKQSMRAYFLVDDLTHLHRGGRLNGAQALVGSMLQVKPILHFVDGKIVPFEKIRTQKKAIKRLLDLLDEDAKSNEPIRAVIIHANCPEQAREIKQTIEKRYSNVEITMSYFGAVIGTHLGEGSLGLGWYKK